ncbi:MAG: ribosome biogenesis GTPase Der [Candidatus Margulisbacteria bacterium]|nr:ribosome biogenesis GTPase Der [Candidatus Margulisiibacteriota bacterium]
MRYIGAMEMEQEMPNVLIMGRPNVGKSTLINRIIGQRRAITSDVSGVTRDILTYSTEWEGKSFAVVDSGGVFIEESEGLYLQSVIEGLVHQAIERADVIVFVVDYKDGLHPVDIRISKALRPVSQKVKVAVNKVDDVEKRYDIGQFYKLGLGTPIPISSLHGNGLGTLLTCVTDTFSDEKGVVESSEDILKIAIVGRPNVGKSSLTNAIINERRVIVDDKAGTTRDTIEVYFEHGDQKYLIVDTAGMKKLGKIRHQIDYYATLRSQRSLHEVDLVVMVMSVDSILADQDKKIINLILKHHQRMVIFVNKCDLLLEDAPKKAHVLQEMREVLPELAYFPIMMGSAHTTKGVQALLNHLPIIVENGLKRVTTSQLNQFVDTVIKRTPPPAKRGKQLKVYYATQASVKPPTFVFFVNYPNIIDAGYSRFVEKWLRSHFPWFEGSTILLKFRKHS